MGYRVQAGRGVGCGRPRFWSLIGKVLTGEGAPRRDQEIGLWKIDHCRKRGMQVGPFQIREIT